MLKRFIHGMFSTSWRQAKRNLPKPVRRGILIGRTAHRLTKARNNKQRLGIVLTRTGRKLEG